MKKTNVVPLRTITNSSAATGDHYVPKWIPVRPGSQDHEVIPSRRADGLVYRDGQRYQTLPDASGEIAGYGGLE